MHLDIHQIEASRISNTLNAVESWTKLIYKPDPF